MYVGITMFVGAGFGCDGEVVGGGGGGSGR